MPDLNNGTLAVFQSIGTVADARFIKNDCQATSRPFTMEQIIHIHNSLKNVLGMPSGPVLLVKSNFNIIL